MTGLCFCFLIYLIISVVIIVVTFLLVTCQWHPSMPILQLESASASHVNYSASSTPFFKLTMDAQFSLKNLNSGRFVYDNSTVMVVYRSSKIGSGVFGNGVVKGRETKRINVTCILSSPDYDYINDNIFDDIDAKFKNLTNDLLSGSLGLATYTKLSGSIFLNIFKKRRTAPMFSALRLNITSPSN